MILGAQQIAHAQTRGYVAGVGVVGLRLEVTSDNGSHWSAPLEVLH